MKLIIIIIIAFLVLVYVYTYIKYKKRRSQTTNSVNEFHKKYLMKNASQKHTTLKDNTYTKYVTRYNSKLDYVEKDNFLNS